MRVIIVFVLAFTAGFILRPRLIDLLEPYLPPWVIEFLDPATDGEPEPQDFAFYGTLSNEGFDDGGLAPAGEGADQIFNQCDPVEVVVSIAPVEGAPPVSIATQDGGYILIEETSLSFEMRAGARDTGAPTNGRAIVRSGEITSASRVGPETMTLSTEYNTIVQTAQRGDAFGYVELIPALRFRSETARPDAIESYTDLEAFFEAVEGVSGRFEFRYCDASMNDGFCPPTDDTGLPFATYLAFSESCDFG